MRLARNIAAAGAFAFGLTACAVAATDLSGEWRVERIDGADVVDGSTVTLDFFEPGRLAGSGGCNRYTTSLADEGFPVGSVAGTMMACSEPLMEQEARFFAALESATRHEVEETGRLLLYAGDTAEPVIVARRPAEP